MSPLDLLAIVAHPDDAELLCGGALIRAADAGRRTGILDLTQGETASAGNTELRASEAARAAEVIGLTARHNAGLPDGALENTPAARHTVAALLRALRPDTVVLMWHQARHPDHRVASRLAYDACFLAGLRNAPVDGAPFRPRKVVYALSYREHGPKPTFVLDIADVMDRKLEAIACYRSQFQGKKALGEVYAGGDRELADQIRVHAAYYGGLIRTAYGEPYWTQETMAVRDIAGLGVATF